MIILPFADATASATTALAIVTGALVLVTGTLAIISSATEAHARTLPSRSRQPATRLTPHIDRS